VGTNAAVPDLSVVPLGPERAADWLAFFDRDAFADNPEWAGCYCRCLLVPTGDEWMRATPAQNRAAMSVRVASGEQRGMLAYADGRMVGWMHAAPLSALPHCHARMRVDRPADADRVGAVVCVLVSAPYRRRGIARALLDGACESLRAAGLDAIEAYPLRPDLAPNDAENFYGPLALYLGAGLRVVAETGRDPPGGGRLVVRKELGG
jgi:GNAT superfamily N-acetyltransferase